MSVSKFKLALSVSETGEISIDSAIALDDAKLIDMLKEVSPQIEEFATAAYIEAKTKALAVYEQATQLAVYGVYTQYYLEKMLSHPLTAYYGGVYQMYASASKGFEVVCDVAELAISVKNYPLNEEQINAIVTALGMESADALKNSKGEITIDSIEAYVDKLFKNTPASEALEQMKEDLTEALSQAESIVKGKVNEITAEYKPQIESAMTSARQILATVENMMNNLPEPIKAVMDDATSNLEAILAEIDGILDGDKIELSELRSLANRLDERATEYLNKIKADLSDEELAELEKRKEAVIAKMSDQKQVLEKALNDAEKIAKDYLSKLKEALSLIHI